MDECTCDVCEYQRREPDYGAAIEVAFKYADLAQFIDFADMLKESYDRAFYSLTNP